MAPEQARDARSCDIRADIYSLGCVLYHTLAGRTPFPDKNILSQMIRHATETPRPLKEFNPAVPEGLQQILGRMMAKDPGQRYPTPEHAAQALQVFLASGVEAPTAPAADAKMHSFLTWLNVENNKPEATLAPAAPPRPPSGTVPVALPVKQPPPGGPAAPPAKKEQTKTGKGKRRSRRHKHRQPAQLAVPMATTVPPAPVATPVAAGEFDVELVPAALLSGKEPPAPGGNFRLSRRDLVLFSIGVLGTLAAIAFAWLLAHVF
jgi:serine/threonine-protein kinase